MNHGSNNTQSKKLTGQEIAKHNNRDDCWVIIHGKAYDVTEFLPEHPGGPKIILKYAGKDGTEEYDPIHPPDTLDKFLDKSKHLGEVDMSTVEQEEKEEDPEEAERLERVKRMPILEQCYNLMDFEAVARRVMKKTAWAYYSSGADDEITMRENHGAFHKIWFRPRILQDVENIDLSTTMLGSKVSIPFYVTATALGKLGNPEGEVVLTRGARKHNVVQMIPTLASCSFDEIVDAKEGDQVQWLQLYVNKNREITERIVKHAESRGCKGLFITVDAPQLGRREKDMRSKFSDVGSNVQNTGGDNVDRSQGAARAISSFIDPALSWKDIPWFKSITKMPIILKGVQRVEDVIRAVSAGCDGVVLSNHGGRQLDFARSGVEVLAEVMPELRRLGLDDKIEVFIDGGIRRATDIIKALCLGAKGVGIGRPFLYAMSAYGLPGVDRAMQLLKDEMEMNMRLIGCNSVDQLGPEFVDTRGLSMHSTDIQEAAQSASKFFNSKLDCLVNNAASTSGVGGPSLSDGQSFIDTWHESLETNLTGPMLMSQACLPMLEKSASQEGSSSSIIHVSSTRAIQSELNNEPYSTTKAGLLGLTQSMAVSLADQRIRVNAILPGWINVSNECKAADENGEKWEDGLSKDDQAWHLTGRVGKVEDMLKAVEYLVHADFATGTEVVVDGGVTRKMVYPE
ncbi:Cytochrome b2 [Hortaea werneckii]|nr:Cytochrome b2 [Hortaea werneckii]